MHERDETILFSAIAVLLATLTLGGLADLASPDARAVTNGRELHISRAVENERKLRVSRDAVCTSTTEAPAVRTGADQRG